LGAQKFTKAPYFFATKPTPVDYEAEVITLLEHGLTSQANGAPRTGVERGAYATALASFAPTANGMVAIARVKTVLGAELALAPDADTRALVRQLIDLVDGVAPAAPKSMRH
jgi:hypothetical protein